MLFETGHQPQGMEIAAQSLMEREDGWPLPRVAVTSDQVAEEDSLVSALLEHTLELTDADLDDPAACREVLLACYALRAQSRLRFFLSLIRVDADRYAAIVATVDGVIRLGAVAPVAELMRLILLQDIMEPGRRRRVAGRLQRAA